MFSERCRFGLFSRPSRRRDKRVVTRHTATSGGLTGYAHGVTAVASVVPRRLPPAALPPAFGFRSTPGLIPAVSGLQANAKSLFFFSSFLTQRFSGGVRLRFPAFRGEFGARRCSRTTSPRGRRRPRETGVKDVKAITISITVVISPDTGECEWNGAPRSSCLWPLPAGQTIALTCTKCFCTGNCASSCFSQQGQGRFFSSSSPRGAGVDAEDLVASLFECKQIDAWRSRGGFGGWGAFLSLTKAGLAVRCEAQAADKRDSLDLCP